jgi:hypothetical protein
MASATPSVPIGMREVCRRFERWRRSHKGKGRPLIPESLWASAAEIAKEHGVFRTAQVLRLEYNKLKRRVQSPAAATLRRAPAPAFVELMAPPVMGGAECVIELEGPRGKMRIQWKGTAPPDLSGLSRALWGPA